MGRIIVLHSKERVIDLDQPAAAHCFGPFTSYAAALAWDKKAEDDCYKVALDLVGPLQRDIDDHPLDPPEAYHGPHHEGWHGSKPKLVDDPA